MSRDDLFRLYVDLRPGPRLLSVVQTAVSAGRGFSIGDRHSASGNLALFRSCTRPDLIYTELPPLFCQLRTADCDDSGYVSRNCG